jgi:hypothetical protein
MGYYGYAICTYHWHRECNEDDDFDIKKLFDVPEHKTGKDV